jgi:peptidoglycan hydrolase-like protein with peptidoglycan-binding domain
MSTLSRKIVSFALTATTVLSLSGALAFVPVANAQTSTDLQNQINALLSQIGQLQGQLAPTASSGTTTTLATPPFSRNLTVGSKGNDVMALQQWLNAKGYTIATSGSGSPGNETTYFGARTRAAVARFQRANGIRPAVGFFGPLTRNFIASMATTFPTPNPVPNPNPNPIPNPTPIPAASGLSVSLASTNPASGALISSGGSAAARVPVFAINLTAGNSGAVTITAMNFHKMGVISDSSIAGAYIVENNRVLYQYNSVNQGVIGFSGLSLTVAAGRTRTVWLAIDPTSGLFSGNTVSFGLNGPSDITAWDVNNTQLTPNGSFPITGNVFTVTQVANPSIGSLIISSSSVGSTVYAGTQNVLVSQWTLNGQNSPLNLTSLNFRVVGSANKTDIRNVKLMINGTQVGSTLPSVGADGNAFFDLSALPARINTGTSNMQVVADISGSPSFTFAFEILNGFDVYAIDTQYNVPVQVTVIGGAGTPITIQPGQITVTVDTLTPTSNIAKGGSGTVLAKFDVFAAGEPVRIKFLTITLTQTTTTGDNTWSNTNGVPDLNLKNIMLVDDQGNQVGSTINTIGAGGSSSNQCQITSGTRLTCFFGTSASNISYVVPANTTRVIAVRADIQSTAAFTTITAALAGDSNNLQGLTSSVQASTGSANGSTLTLAANSLLVSKNSAYGNQNFAKGSTGAKVGSYVLTASSAEGVNISNFTINMNASSTNFQNLTAKVGSTVIGTSYPTLSANTNYTFSGNVNVPIGGTQIIDIYADVLNSASGSMGALTTFVGCTGTGQVTFSSASCVVQNGGTGQLITVAGTLTLTISNNNSFASRQVVMGNTNVSLAKVLLQDTTGIEPLRVQELRFTVKVASTTTVGQAFQNMKLYDGNGTFISGAGPISLSPGVGSTYVADFNFGSAQAVVVNSGSNLQLELRGDIPPFTSGSNIENATSAISIASTADVVAFGRASNLPVTIQNNASNALVTLTTLRSKLNLAAAVLGSDSTCFQYTGGSPSNRSRTAVDYLSCLKFSADASGQDVHVNTVTLTFQGAALTATTPFTVALIDPQTTALYDGSATSTCTVVNSTCSVSFGFVGTPINAGQTKGVVVQLNSSAFANVAQQFDGLDMTLNTAANVGFGDGVAGTGATPSGLSLSADVSTPLLLTHADYQ